jgi:hypothetical protein
MWPCDVSIVSTLTIMPLQITASYSIL